MRENLHIPNAEDFVWCLHFMRRQRPNHKTQASMKQGLTDPLLTWLWIRVMGDASALYQVPKSLPAGAWLLEAQEMFAQRQARNGSMTMALFKPTSLHLPCPPSYSACSSPEPLPLFNLTVLIQKSILASTSSCDRKAISSPAIRRGPRPRRGSELFSLLKT